MPVLSERTTEKAWQENVVKKKAKKTLNMGSNREKGPGGKSGGGEPATSGGDRNRDRGQCFCEPMRWRSRPRCKGDQSQRQARKSGRNQCKA